MGLVVRLALAERRALVVRRGLGVRRVLREQVEVMVQYLPIQTTAVLREKLAHVKYITGSMVIVQ